MASSNALRSQTSSKGTGKKSNNEMKNSAPNPANCDLGNHIKCKTSVDGPTKTFHEYYSEILIKKSQLVSMNENENIEDIDFTEFHLSEAQYQETKIAYWATLPKIIKDIYVEDSEVSEMSDAVVQNWRRNADIKVEIFKNRKSDATIIDKIPNPVLSLEQGFGKYKDIINKLKLLNISKPTAVQAQAWPVLLRGLDLVLVSQTGKGKLITYLIPALIHILKQPTPLCERKGPNVLIVAPTTELVMQIKREWGKISPKNINAICLYGETCSVTKQQINRAQIVFATPKRLYDLVSSNTFNEETISYLVLDEVDRILNMAYEPQLRLSLQNLRGDVQSVITTASFPEMLRLRTSFSKNPVQIVVGRPELTPYPVIHQEIIFEIDDIDAKVKRLLKYLSGLKKTQKLVVFCSTRVTAVRVATDIGMQGYNAQCISRIKDKESGLEDMRAGVTNILITIDSLSTSLDIDNITDIINFDFPNLDEYILRVERVKRAGRMANVATFMSHADSKRANALMLIFKHSKQEVPSQLAKMAELFLKRRRASRMTYNREFHDLD